jgi:hypothetical protein
MSAPQEIQNQPGANRPADEPMDVAMAVGHLRVLVCGLGAGLLIVGLALTAFVYKQNRNLMAATALRQHQVSQLQASESSLGYLVNELVKYSAGKPELMALFAKHGMEVHAPAAAAPALPPAKR